MPFVIKLLGHGTVGAGAATVYQVTTPVLGGIVNNLRLVNAGGSAATVNVFYRATTGGTQIRVFDKDYSLAASAVVVIKPEITLATSQLIEVSSSAAVDYVVSGMEQV